MSHHNHHHPDDIPENESFPQDLPGEESEVQEQETGREKESASREEAAALGVEGFDVNALRQAVLNAGGEQSAARNGRAITYADLYVWGLSGTAGSREERYDFLKQLGLPPRLSKKALCDVLNSLYTWEEIDQMQNGPQQG